MRASIGVLQPFIVHREADREFPVYDREATVLNDNQNIIFLNSSADSNSTNLSRFTRQFGKVGQCFQPVCTCTAEPLWTGWKHCPTFGIRDFKSYLHYC